MSLEKLPAAATVAESPIPQNSKLDEVIHHELLLNKEQPAPNPPDALKVVEIDQECSTDVISKPPTAPSSSLIEAPSAKQLGQSKEEILNETVKRVGTLLGQSPQLSKTASTILKSIHTEDEKKMDASMGQEQGISSFQYRVIRDIIEEVVLEHQEQIRADVQNMHIELLKQFQIQKREMKGMLERHLPATPLLELVQRLQLENDRLSRNF